MTYGRWGIESARWLRDTARAEDANTGPIGKRPQVIPTIRDIGISLLRLVEVTQIAGSTQAISRAPVLNLILCRGLALIRPRRSGAEPCRVPSS